MLYLSSAWIRTILLTQRYWKFLNVHLIFPVTARFCSETQVFIFQLLMGKAVELHFYTAQVHV